MKAEKSLSTEIASATVQLQDLKNKGDMQEFKADAMAVHDAITLSEARGILTQIADINKKITAFIKPVKKAFKTYVASFGAGANTAEEVIREKINDYAKEEERKRQIEEAALRKKQEAAAAQARIEAEKIREQQRKDNPEAAPIAIPPIFVPPPVRLTSTVDEGFRTYWKYQITDTLKIPAKYWLRVLDEKQIAADVTAQKENFSEPGIETYTEKKVVAG